MIVKLIKTASTAVYSDVRVHEVERDSKTGACELDLKVRNPQGTGSFIESHPLEPTDVVKAYTDSGVLIDWIVINSQCLPSHLGDR